MIVRTLADAQKTDRRIVTEKWESTRMLLANDGMGFSFHITTLYAGHENPMWYQNHLESVYCLEGRGEVETVSDGRKWKVEPGTLYVLDQNDQHVLRVEETIVCACVFNPPLRGKEVHDASGAYSLDAEEVRD